MEFAKGINVWVIFSLFGVAFIILYIALCNNFGQFNNQPSIGRYNASYFGYYNVTASSKNVPVVKDKFYELRLALQAASTEDKTVILTTLNEAWAAPNSIFDLFIESFRIGNNTSWLLNHLLVIAVDDKAYNRCQVLVTHCYLLKTNNSSTMASEARFMTPVYLEMMWGRLAFLQIILRLGYNFLFTDTNVMWFRNPFPYFTLDSDFQTSCDEFNGNEFDVQNAPNNGFLFVRSNKRTIKFYKFWVYSRHTYPELHEQDIFNLIKNDTYVKKIGMKSKFLSTDYFGGFCTPSKDFNKVCTMHANCCIGLDTKVADLKATLEDWMFYFSSNHTIMQPYQWSVPKQCHINFE